MILNFSPNSLTCFFTCHSFSFKNLIPKIQNPIKFSKNIIFILSESCQGVTVTCHQNKTTLRHFRIVWSFSNLKRSPCRFLFSFWQISFTKLQYKNPLLSRRLQSSYGFRERRICFCFSSVKDQDASSQSSRAVFSLQEARVIGI